MADWVGIVWLVVLLLGNAFFVAAEFAVVSARRSQIEPLAERGVPSARTALWAMEHATLMLAMSQLGITVCSLLILNVSEPAIHHLIELPLERIGFPDGVVSALSFTTALVIVSYLHVVLGEMVPKNISFSIPGRAVLLLAPPLVFLARLCRPVIASLNAIANGILRLFRVRPANEIISTYTLDQVATIVNHSTREGVLADVSGTLASAFEFSTKQVSDIAVSLADLTCLPADATPADLERAVARHGFSRYVIVGETGEPDGYVHLKDILDLDEAELDQPFPPSRVRALSAVRDDTDLEDALAMMRASGSHLARALSGAGSTTGVLFLEDILEELVGEVQDATRRDHR